MYLNFYNLKKQPFHITPDPEFLYLSPSHKEALAAIIYGIEQKKGFIGIIGAVGAGKTTILRSYLETTKKKAIKTIYVFNASLSFKELVKTIYQELGLQIESNEVLEMVNNLYSFLIEEYKQGNTVVLIIDEAQNMPVETLENLRMLSNLETSKDKLIQIILVGQTEFEDKLDLHRLRQLKQRLAIRATILPLTRDESLEYIAFRLRKAGSNPGSVFTAPALNKIVKTAKGIPRVLNILCDNALITGFGYQCKPVTKKVAKEIIRDFKGSKQSTLRRLWLPVTSALVVMSLGTTWLLLHTEAVLNKIGMPISQEERESGAGVKGAKRSEKPTDKIEEKHESVKKSEVSPLAAKNESRTITKTVKRGDTLSKLAQEVYGNSEAQVMKVVREGNPQVSNPDLIHSGSTITFPKLPERE